MIDDQQQIEDLLAQPAKAIKTAINILDAWQATEEQAAAMLGLEPDQLRQWRESKSIEYTREQYERVSHIISIWAYLQVLFPHSEIHKKWPGALNSAPLFNNQPPMQLMATGRLEDLAKVYEWVAGWRYNG